MRKEIIYDLPADEYYSYEAVSNSRLTAFKESPAKYKWAISRDKEESDAMKFGTALHMAVLEPKRFCVRYHVIDKLDGRTKEGKEQVRHIEAFESAGISVLPRGDYEMIERIRSKFDSHQTIPAILNGVKPEVSMFWEDPDTGLQMKSRCDAFNLDYGLIVDLKSSVTAKADKFLNKAIAMGYHRQAAVYQDGAKILGQPFQDYVLIVAENTAPNEVAVSRMLPELVEVGRREYKALLASYKECLEKDHWPSYPEGIQDLGAPLWLINKLEGEYDE